MNRNLVLRTPALIACLLLALPAVMRADDSAASIAAGGLVARRETRVVMAKEVLRISPTKVVVDYDFRNDSDQDVTTEVAFPIPAYTEGPDEWPAEKTSFSDFQVQVNGSRIPIKSEARAFLNGKEITGILAADKIDVASFGHHDWNADRIPDLTRLPNTEQKRLVNLGVFEPDSSMGTWTVHLQYHWTQNFPAHSTIHIRHEYTPNEGFEMMERDAIRKALHEPALDSAEDSMLPADTKLLAGFCPDSQFLRGVERGIAESQESYAHPHWVDFILTSANTWQRPIEDFTLIVERGVTDADKDMTLVSFCSPEHTPVEKIDAEHFQVHLTNFIPESELRIGFFEMPTNGHKAAFGTSKK